MKILNSKSKLPQQVSLILGFFDGVHLGHADVIKNTLSEEKVVVTFSSSPAEYFNGKVNYIYPREYNYDLLHKLGVKYIYEQEFADIAKMSAEEYLDMLVQKFNPISITTGFNHTFGAKKRGTPDFLEEKQGTYKFLCTPATTINNEVISSTYIKKFLQDGNLEQANNMLGENFTLFSTVVKGVQLGRKLGFPTANMEYPSGIVKIPYGVYKVKVLDLYAVMNWGVKPTLSGKEEVLEVYIPNFNGNLYNKTLAVEVISKIRNEKKFDSLDELKKQIEKDVNACLEL